MDVSETISKLKEAFPEADEFQEHLKRFEEMDKAAPAHRKYELLVSINTQVNRYLGPFPYADKWKNQVTAVLKEAYDKVHRR